MSVESLFPRLESLLPSVGKPIQYALSVDVPATARCIAWYAGR